MHQGPTVIFMLGGPGSGKGTQCQLLHDHFNFHHLSAGDLLREERKKEGSENGALIEKYIVQGKIVPSEITIKLLEAAMHRSGWDNGKFLIDGFPRNEQNLNEWLRLMEKKARIPFMIFLECSEETMISRCLKRGETSLRVDDNIDSLKKRFKTLQEQTMKVINYFDKENKLVRINSQKAVGEVFAELEKVVKKQHLN